MIDAFAILSTSMAIMFILIRAIKLDATVPWFESAETPADTNSGNDVIGWHSNNGSNPKRY